jgi:hypothetical protein
MAIERENGMAVLVAMMAVLLMTAIGTALVLSSSSETTIAAHFRSSFEAHAAATAMLDRGMDELLEMDDWSAVIDGLVQSSWVDGSPGLRRIADGSTIDLTQVVSVASCQKSTACTPADLAEVTPDRPWGEHNPQWKLYAYGPLREMLPPGALDSPYYVVLLVGAGPLASQLAARAEAFGPLGAHAVVELTAGRAAVSGDEKDYNGPPEQGAVKVLSWREVR